MTQLFDTNTYVSSDFSEPAGRHLRSIPAGDLTDRTTQWRLDDDTIEIGRKGIQAAREALQAAARVSSSTKLASSSSASSTPVSSTPTKPERKAA